MDGGTTESSGGGRSTVVEGLGGLEGWWNSSGIALWSFVLFGAFLLNATLLLAFLKRPGLRTISNRFVMNLAVSNLLTCAVLNPLLMLDAPSASSASSSPSTTCAIAEGATALVTTSSMLSVLLIAVDQYLAVVDPLRYRTRIDKLKCGILTISVWLVSGVFGLLAGFNPNPRSLWLVCSREFPQNLPRSVSNYTENATLDWTIDSSLRFVVNTTSEDYSREDGSTFAEFNEDLRLFENSSTTIIHQETIVEDISPSSMVNLTEYVSQDFQVSYGLVYATAYALLAYLLPFVGVCWIYVSIYSAAHKNSERTRRTGSRPILSSGSFSEEYYPVRQDVSTEDFRRIPKISSLSSIDESIETLTPSQIMPRRGSEFASSHNNHHETASTIEEEEPTAVIFTVGSRKVDVTPQPRASTNVTRATTDHHTKDNKNNDEKVPIAVLKAQFLGNTETSRPADDLVKSKFRDEPNQKRKSSHDLMYEEMLRKDLEKLRMRHASSEDDTTDDDEEEEEEEEEEAAAAAEEDDDEEEAGRNGAFEKDKNSSVSRDVETGEPGFSRRQNTACRSFIVECANEGDEKEMPGDRSPSSSESDARHVTGVSNINDGLSTPRKNSLEDPAVGNIPSHSSILKSQHGSLLNGKINSRNSHGFHRSDLSQGMNFDDHIYGKHSNGNFDAHGSVFGSNTPSTPIVTITPPNKASLHRVSSIRSTSSYINSLKHRISNGSLFKYREETRAARISALVIVMGLICWTPYVIVLLLRNIPFVTEDWPHGTDVAALSFLILAAYITPLLFGYRSRRVKRELRKFFCFRRELSYKNNRSLMAKKVLKRRHSGNLSQLEMDTRYNIFNCVYGRTRWPKDKVHFVQVPETALVVETCRSSFSSGASTQISSTSTEEC